MADFTSPLFPVINFSKVQNRIFHRSLLPIGNYNYNYNLFVYFREITPVAVVQGVLIVLKFDGKAVKRHQLLLVLDVSILILILFFTLNITRIQNILGLYWG